jgi:hypothetical protein
MERIGVISAAMPLEENLARDRTLHLHLEL